MLYPIARPASHRAAGSRGARPDSPGKPQLASSFGRSAPSSESSRPASVPRLDRRQRRHRRRGRCRATRRRSYRARSHSSPCHPSATSAFTPARSTSTCSSEPEIARTHRPRPPKPNAGRGATARAPPVVDELEKRKYATTDQPRSSPSDDASERAASPSRKSRADADAGDMSPLPCAAPSGSATKALHLRSCHRSVAVRRLPRASPRRGVRTRRTTHGIQSVPTLPRPQRSAAEELRGDFMRKRSSSDPRQRVRSGE